MAAHKISIPLLKSLLPNNKYFLSLFQEMFANHGDILYFEVGKKRAYIIKHPDYAKHILLDHYTNYIKGEPFEMLAPYTGDGIAGVPDYQQWRKQRHVLSPAFHNKNIELYAKNIVDFTNSTIKNWQQYVTENKPIDIIFSMEKLTFDTVTSTLMNLDPGDTADQLYQDTSFISRYLEKHIMPIDRLLGMFKRREKKEYHKHLESMNQIFYTTINQHLDDTKPNTFINMLMAGYDEHAGAYKTYKHIRDELATVLLAGYETVSSLLSWTWVLLSKHPDIEKRLSEELTTVLNGRDPTFADLAKLTYTKCILMEALRLYPPAWLLIREAVEEDTIADEVIPKKSSMYLFIYFLHRHPEYWQNPEGFNPDRFAQGLPPELKHIYCPFGEGPRSCIGSTYAMMEAQLILAIIAQRYYFDLLPGAQIEPTPALTLKPAEKSLMMKVRLKQV